MSNGIEIKNLPSATTIKQNDTMTIVQDKQNKQLSLDIFANESDLATLSVLENRCDEVKAKIEVDEYSAEITTSQSMSKIGSDDSGANLHENVLDGAFESCVLKGKTKYIDNDTQEILDTFQEGRNLSLIDVKSPILSNVGKNLFSCSLMMGLWDKIQKKTILNNNFFCTTDLIRVHPNTRIKVSGTAFNPEANGNVFFYDKDKNYLGDDTQVWILNKAKIPSNAHYMAFHFGVSYLYDINGTVQIEIVDDVSSPTTAYEPYKSSILSLPEEVVLRSLPDGTCDTLNVETGEYVQKIGERSYQNGDTNSNTLVTDGTKTQYKLSSPITTKVDVQGFPHAYKNGHIQLSSGSTEPSLTPTVTYKVPVSRVGQIASNTKSNLRQTIKLDQLEILAYQSLINAEYENLLVQNSAESAASFTNLSTNDPKDELYYMLKHLIEENQPVQNMLDKINLFYLYGLLSDEHYFDLLLGGEEDVY